jgi:hypothetical protein
MSWQPPHHLWLHWGSTLPPEGVMAFTSLLKVKLLLIFSFIVQAFNFICIVLVIHDRIPGMATPPKAAYHP